MAFETALRRRKQRSDLGLLIGSQETLNSYVADTWARTHAVTSSASTARDHAGLYDRLIALFLGELRLVELTPELVARWQPDRIAAGAGRTSVLNALSLLASVLQWAVESERLARNPVGLVRKAARPARREVRPLAPTTVEALRAVRDPRDATLISVLAYAGLPPRRPSR